MFTTIACFTALFGLAAPEPNPVRWLGIASPILLAAWLACAKQMIECRSARIGLAMMAAPILLLVALFTMAVGTTA
ncbi:hypothetical protein [Sphingomonas sanguinis]|uniref:hypothetical protein n=1 Tax=Sphingomonas sanguinis TaxID=33051 RepID=UPI00187C7FF9|nr:hypothetical protein [Sphingomonas sanguinis]